MEVHMKQRCAIEFLPEEKVRPTDIHQCLLNIHQCLLNIHQCLLNIYGDQTVNVSMVRQWVVRFSGGESDSGLPLLVHTFTS